MSGLEALVSRIHYKTFDKKPGADGTRMVLKTGKKKMVLTMKDSELYINGRKSGVWDLPKKVDSITIEN